MFIKIPKHHHFHQTELIVLKHVAVTCAHLQQPQISMNRLKSTQLQELALHCGYLTASAKPARIDAIERSAKFANGLLPKNHAAGLPLRVLSIDVGIKNFSYCKATYVGNAAVVDEWSVMDLHEKYGNNTLNSSVLVTEEKAYMAKLAVNVVDSLLLPTSRTALVPHIVTVENQRTRSNNSTATLPNVLLNFILEHMIYATIAARKSTHAALSDTQVVSMNSNKMVNFWFARFQDRKKKQSSAKSKRLRSILLDGWLIDNSIAPFDLSLLSQLLPVDYADMKPAERTRAVNRQLGLPPKQKRDDLVDSLLYNLAIVKQLQHHQELHACIQQDDPDVLASLVDRWNRQHLEYLTPLLSDSDFSLANG